MLRKEKIPYVAFTPGCVYTVFIQSKLFPLEVYINGNKIPGVSEKDRHKAQS